MDESQNSLFYAPELLTSDIDSGSARIPAKRKPKHNKRGNAPTKYNGIEWLCRHCDQGFTHRTHLSTHYVGDHNIIAPHWAMSSKFSCCAACEKWFRAEKGHPRCAKTKDKEYWRPPPVTDADQADIWLCEERYGHPSSTVKTIPLRFRPSAEEYEEWKAEVDNLHQISMMQKSMGQSPKVKLADSRKLRKAWNSMKPQHNTASGSRRSGSDAASSDRGTSPRSNATASVATAPAYCTSSAESAGLLAAMAQHPLPEPDFEALASAMPFSRPLESGNNQLSSNGYGVGCPMAPPFARAQRFGQSYSNMPPPSFSTPPPRNLNHAAQQSNVNSFRRPSRPRVQGHAPRIPAERALLAEMEVTKDVLVSGRRHFGADGTSSPQNISQQSGTSANPGAAIQTMPLPQPKNPHLQTMPMLQPATNHEYSQQTAIPPPAPRAMPPPTFGTPFNPAGQQQSFMGDNPFTTVSSPFFGTGTTFPNGGFGMNYNSSALTTNPEFFPVSAQVDTTTDNFMATPTFVENDVHPAQQSQADLPSLAGPEVAVTQVFFCKSHGLVPVSHVCSLGAGR